MAEETVIGTEQTIAEYKASREAAAKSAEVVEETPEIEETEDTDAEEQPKGEDKPKPRGGFQKKIDRLIKQVASTNEELAAERRKTAELEAKNGKQPEKVATSQGEPDRNDFANDIEYVKALAKWEVRQEMKLEAEREVREAAEDKQRTFVKNYNEKVVEAKATHEDWDEVVNQDLDIPGTVGLAILRMPNGPEVAYQLGKNPELAEELMQMDELEAIGKIWELSKELGKSTEEEPEKKEKKAIPPPIRTVSAGTTRTSTVSIDKTSIAEYKRRTADARKTNQVRTVH